MFGCIPPIQYTPIQPVTNVSEIALAECSGPANVIFSMFFLPRLLLHAWIWSLLTLSSPWIRPTLFFLLYPFAYDYGGLGPETHFAADLFCFIVNLYYWVLIILIIFLIFVVDQVFFSLTREIYYNAEMGRIDVELQDLRENINHRMLFTEYKDNNTSRRET